MMRRLPFALFFVFLFSFLFLSAKVNNALATTVTLTATADTKIVGSPTTSNTNYGTSTTIETRKTDDEKGRALISFDISSVPSNATINSATFFIYFYTCGRLSQTIDDLNISRITGVWKENLATWNTEKNNFDLGTALHKTAPCSSTGKYLKYDIKTFVNNWRNGTWTNYGIGLSGDEGSEDSWRKSFYSKEHGSNNPPKLEINYTVPGQPTGTGDETGEDAAETDEEDTTSIQNGGKSATTSATISAQKATPSTAISEKAKGISGARIALIVALVVILGALTAGYIIYRRRKKLASKKDKEPEKLEENKEEANTQEPSDK